MATPSSPNSFSASRRWAIVFSVALSTVAMVALVAMVIYLGGRHYHRFNLASQTRIQLSSQTLNLLRSITNEVRVVLLYDKTDPLYQSVDRLAKEYKDANPRIKVESVDYLRDASAAAKIQETYKDRIAAVGEKDLVIFDSGGHTLLVPGSLLGEYEYGAKRVNSDKQLEYPRVLKSFTGEMWFTSRILAVTTGQPLKAYFVQDHGEHDPDSEKMEGYAKFRMVLVQNNVVSAPLKLLDVKAVPDDCNLLVIAGPSTPFLESELQKIGQYLDQGGRVLVLFNWESLKIVTGLESILNHWGVEVGNKRIRDPSNSSSGAGEDLLVSDFSKSHPAVRQLVGFRLDLLRPRAISRRKAREEEPNPPQVDELAFTGPQPFLGSNPMPENHPISLMAAVDGAPAKGVFANAQRGSTRIVVAGDSKFLDNQFIDLQENRDFAGSAVNWLLDQNRLLQGIPPRPVTEYRLMISQSEMESLQLIFLAGMPGAVLIFGGLVWLRRRH